MQHQLSKWLPGAARSCHSSVSAQRRVYNDLGKSGGQQADSAPAKALQTAEAMRAALRAALVQESSAVMQAHKDNDILRPLHLFANLMLSLWIGACFASMSPCAHGFLGLHALDLLAAYDADREL